MPFLFQQVCRLITARDLRRELLVSSIKVSRVNRMIGAHCVRGHGVQVELLITLKMINLLMPNRWASKDCRDMEKQQLLRWPMSHDLQLASLDLPAQAEQKFFEECLANK